MKSHANCYAIWKMKASVSETDQKLRNFYGRKYTEIICENFNQDFKHRFFIKMVAFDIQ